MDEVAVFDWISSMVLQILIDQTTPAKFLMVNWLLGFRDPRRYMMREVLPSGEASVNLTAGDWLLTVLLQQTRSFVDLRASLPRIHDSNNKAVCHLHRNDLIDVYKPHKKASRQHKWNRSLL